MKPPIANPNQKRVANPTAPATDGQIEALNKLWPQVLSKLDRQTASEVMQVFIGLANDRSKPYLRPKSGPGSKLGSDLNSSTTGADLDDDIPF